MPSQHIVKNRILRQLPADELKNVQPWLTLVQLRANTVLLEQGAPIDQVYFPLSGMVSLLVVMETGEAVETGNISAEGLLGGDAPINGHLSTQATVQFDGTALMMPKAQFVDAYHAHPHLRDLVNRYKALLLMQARQNAGCHALQSVRHRLCRWLLQSGDITGSATHGRQTTTRPFRRFFEVIPRGSSVTHSASGEAHFRSIRLFQPHTHHRCSRAHMRELIRALEIRDLQARSHTMALTLAQAAQATGLNRSTILRAIKSGRISGTRDDLGAWTVEPVELHRIFPPAEAEPKAGAASRTA